MSAGKGEAVEAPAAPSAAGVPVVVLDREGRIIGLNQAGEECVGYTLGQLRGARFWEMLPSKEEARAFEAGFREVLRKRDPGFLEVHCVTKSGALRLHSWSLAAATNAEGAVEHVVAAGVDVLEHRRVEAAYRASAERVHRLISSAPLVVFSVDRDGVFTLAEGGGLEAAGRGPSDVVGRSLFEIFRDAPGVVAEARRALTGEPVRFSAEARGVTFEVWCTPLWSRDGETVVGLNGVAVDITERVRTVARLRRRVALEELVGTLSARFINLRPEETDAGIHHALRAVGEFADADRSYVFLLSADGQTLDNTHEWCAEGVEPQIQNLQKLPATTFPWWMEKLRRFENIHIPRVADLPAEARAERELLAAQSIQSLAVVPLVSADRLMGFLGFDSVRKERIWDEEDLALLQMLGTVLVNAMERQRAETARRRLEEQLHQAQKMEAIGRLAGGIAHDFNNLLTVIRGYSELLLESLKNEDGRREEVEKIWEATERAERLTRQLLTFGRHRPAQVQVLEINPLIQEAGKMLRPLIGEKTKLRLRLDPAAGCVRADPNRVEQALLNLVVNARDAMPEGGTLTIETANVEITSSAFGGSGAVPPGSYVTFSVSDTGHGMSDAVRAHIFEPFFSTKRPGRGTGLGLATVYGTVTQAGGQVTVDSEVGRGTTVRVYLPRSDRPLGEAAAREAPRVSHSGRETILLVEDEQAVRALARAALEPCGYTVVEAGDGAEALAWCEKHRGPIHLLLTDVVMPGMDGPELARRLTALHPEMKVLYISGYPHTVPADRPASGLGGELLEKPFAPGALRRKVREVLDAGGGREKTSAPRA